MFHQLQHAALFIEGTSTSNLVDSSATAMSLLWYEGIVNVVRDGHSPKVRLERCEMTVLQGVHLKVYSGEGAEPAGIWTDHDIGPDGWTTFSNDSSPVYVRSLAEGAAEAWLMPADPRLRALKQVLS